MAAVTGVESGVRTMMLLRAVTHGDLPSLGDLLYEAAHVRRELAVLPRAEVLARPSLARYLAGWGRRGDAGVLALVAGVPVGAAWHRLFPATERGTGVLALPDVPELTIAVRAAFRGRGIGSALLVALLDRAWRGGFRRVGLSVDPADPAARLYRRCGFREIGRAEPPPGTSALMLAELG